MAGPWEKKKKKLKQRRKKISSKKASWQRENLGLPRRPKHRESRGKEVLELTVHRILGSWAMAVCLSFPQPRRALPRLTQLWEASWNTKKPRTWCLGAEQLHRHVGVKYPYTFKSRHTSKCTFSNWTTAGIKSCHQSLFRFLSALAL